MFVFPAELDRPLSEFPHASVEVVPFVSFVTACLSRDFSRDSGVATQHPSGPCVVATVLTPNFYFSLGPSVPSCHRYPCWMSLPYFVSSPAFLGFWLRRFCGSRTINFRPYLATSTFSRMLRPTFSPRLEAWFLGFPAPKRVDHLPVFFSDISRPPSCLFLSPLEGCQLFGCLPVCQSIEYRLPPPPSQTPLPPLFNVYAVPRPTSEPVIDVTSVTLRFLVYAFPFPARLNTPSSYTLAPHKRVSLICMRTPRYVWIPL